MELGKGGVDSTSRTPKDSSEGDVDVHCRCVPCCAKRPCLKLFLHGMNAAVSLLTTISCICGYVFARALASLRKTIYAKGAVAKGAV
eukprot:3889663-Amphidinium_carterae.1